VTGRGVAVTVLSVCTALVLAGPALSGSDGISVTLDRTAISTSLGTKFSFRSVVSNNGKSMARDLVAHLNVLSLRTGVYVDPEDWSSHRTRYLPPIPAGGSNTIDWRLQAVNSGSIGVYVAVLTRNGAPKPPTTGPVLHVTIADRKTLNSGGIVPLALGIPGLLGALALLVRIRRRA
jgi:hypothetical protein